LPAIARFLWYYWYYKKIHIRAKVMKKYLAFTPMNFKLNLRFIIFCASALVAKSKIEKQTKGGGEPVARPRHPMREVVMKKWIESGGKIKTKELAEEAGVPESSIRKWKSQDDWKAELGKKKRGGQPGNKNATGHGAPLRNKNAETHGAYSTVHLDDLPPEERMYIESITLDTRENMLRELQLLIAKESDLRKKIKALEQEEESTLHTDKVVEMLVPKSNKRLENNKKKLEELTVERENVVWEIESKTKPSKQLEKKLDKLEREIEALRDKVADEEDGKEGGNEALTTAMKTVVKASPFDRRMKLEAELNKTHGRIIKLLDSIKSYELDCRRVELEEKKYSLAKQKLTGAFNIDPETGEICDIEDDETEEI
jgi:uncharacterized protein YjcR